MSANERIGLPRDKMKKIVIAFDVDGTLRCNCTDTCSDPNKDIVKLFNILHKFKNIDLWVWSGGGKEYAYTFARIFGLPVSRNRCVGKLDSPRLQPDIAIDDIQDTALGVYNLIVRQK